MKTLKTFGLTLVTVLICNSSFTLSSSLKSLDANEDKVNLKLVDELSAAEIIKAYAEDYRSDRFAKDPMLFGIEIPDHGLWTINCTGKNIGETWEVLVNEGMPEQPTFLYLIEFETLTAIYEGKINALTAQGKAFSGDYTPMSIKQMEGYEPSMEDYAKINPFSFHFWTRGFPEIVPFGEGMTRKAHGSNFTVFYYQTGLRTAWYRVLPEERVRDDAREQAAPFPILIVAIKGTTEGEVDGKRVSLEKGNTIFIPAGVNHKWWNETNEATEAILIMFGKGA